MAAARAIRDAARIMKVTKQYLKKIIKEELEKSYPVKESSEELIARAREELRLIDLQRAIERGEFDNQTAAAALRMIADEFEAEVDAAGEDKYDRANKKNREDTEWLLKNMSDTEKYTKLDMPKEDPMGRGANISALRKSVVRDG